MTFGAPHWLWLLLLGLPIVVLYTRRPRRPLVRVPAVWLWTAVAGQASAPTGRVLGRLDERLLALLLFLLALLGTVLGLARPGDERPAARALVVVVDVGAGAGVRDGAPPRPRVERAREALARLEAGLGPDDRRWVVAAGAAPHVIAGPGEPRSPGAPALEGGRADLVGGLALARAVLRGLADDGRAPEVWLLTATPTAARAAADLDVQLIDLRASPGAALDLALDATLERLDADHVRLRTVVENRGRSTTAALVEVLLDGAPLVRERPQPIAPGDRLAFAPRELPCPDGGVVEVRLASGHPGPGLSWVVPPPRRLRVALDDPTEDRFLRAALAVDPGVEVVALDAAPAARPVDVLVTTAGGPSPPGVRAVLRLGPRALEGAVGLTTRGELGPSSPRLVPDDGAGLDLSRLDLEDRLVYAAVRVEGDPGWRVIARAGDQDDAAPLLLVRDDADRREVALTFSPAASDLVLGRAFPLLVARALRWAARHEQPRPRWTRAGEVALLAPRSGASLEGRAPDGAAVPAVVLPDRRAAVRLDRGPGHYAVAGQAIAARPAPRPADDRSAPDSGPSAASATPPRPTPAASWAGACVLMAFLALALEAAVFHRRGLP